jgi:DNA-binding XRE family transcriptional regulator
MPTLAATLKAEIRRLAGREVQKALRPLRRVQRQLKALRLRNRAQRMDLRRLERRVERVKQTAGGGSRGGRGARVSPDAIRTLRGRLRMTREQFAKVLGVSPGSIFGWETGRTMPRGRSVQRIAEVRKMGVRKALAQATGRPRRGVARKGRPRKTLRRPAA